MDFGVGRRHSVEMSIVLNLRRMPRAGRQDAFKYSADLDYTS